MDHELVQLYYSRLMGGGKWEVVSYYSPTQPRIAVSIGTMCTP